MPKPNKESKQDFLSRCTKDLISTKGHDADQAFSLCNSQWDDSKAKASKPLTLTADVQFELAKQDDGTDGNQFMMTAYTGQVMDFGWAGRYVFDLAGMTTKAKIPILREHKRDRVVGHSKKAWAEGGNFLISGEFSRATRDAKEVLSLAQEGYPWQASVGISPMKIKTLDSAKETMVVNGQEVSGPIEIWLESKVGEVSFVSLGADDDTAAISLNEPSESAAPPSPPEGVDEMNLAEIQTKFPDIYQEIMSLGAATVDVKQLQAEATEQGVTAERARVAEIMSAGGDPEATQKAIKDGITADAAYKLFFDAERTKRTENLDALQGSLPESAGASPKPKGDNTGTGFLAQVEQYRKEHDCTKTAALTAVAAKSPEIHQAYVDGLNS